MTTTNPGLDRLSYLIQGEMSALETYDRAITKVKAEATKTALTELRTVHEERLAALTTILTDMGGTLPATSGLCGTYSKWFEGGAALLGEKAIIGALEEFEIKRLADYKSDVEQFDENLSQLVFGQWMPSQQECFEKIAALHKAK
jgi:Domain of unknown function (DUF2383)